MNSGAGEIPHKLRSEPDADPQRTGEKNCRHQRNAANFEYADFSGNGETANDSENDQAENIINDCSAENYFGFIAIFLAQIA